MPGSKQMFRHNARRKEEIQLKSFTMRGGWVLLLLLSSRVLAQDPTEGTLSSTNKALQAIRGAQDESAHIHQSLQDALNEIEGIERDASRIGEYGTERRELAENLRAAKELGAEMQDQAERIKGNLSMSLARLRSSDSKLDSGLEALRQLQRSDGNNGASDVRIVVVEPEGPLEKLDNALETSVATSLAGASLTLGGLLLGLGLPLLVSRRSGQSGATTSGGGRLGTRGTLTPTAEFQMDLAMGAVWVLSAFLCFALAVLENLTLDPSDWSIVMPGNQDLALYFDVITEVGALATGIVMLMYGAARLSRGVSRLVGVKRKVFGMFSKSR